MAVALTVADLSIGQVLNFASKNDPSIKSKCEVIEIIKKEKKAKIKALEGASEGKEITVTVDRLSRRQGRQKGSSPVAKVVETKKPSVKEVAKSSTTASKAKPKKSADELNLKSAKAELLDMAELLQDMNLRAAALHAFLEGYADESEEEEEGEEEEDADESEEEEEEEPAPKKKTGNKRKTSPMSEDD